jgi:hypothetical protein
MGICLSRRETGKVCPTDSIVSAVGPDFMDPWDLDFLDAFCYGPVESIQSKPLSNRERFKHLKIDLNCID